VVVLEPVRRTGGLSAQPAGLKPDSLNISPEGNAARL
jgi:hypothetical protein